MHADIGELGPGLVPPSGQGRHMRFTEAVPVPATTYWLAMQVVMVEHIIAPVVSL
jgi:hypothetical protein